MTECMLWTGAVDTQGYPQAHIKRTTKLVHRWIWQWLHGPIARHVYVLHRCDVRRCVNPDHLFTGSHQDNMTDMKVKGRRKNIGCNEANGMAKLTWQQVSEIRESSLSRVELATLYGVHISQIQRIRAGKQWLTPTGS